MASHTHQPIAFIFPGQGSQKIGMLSAMAEQFSLIQETFTQASDVLGYDMWHLIQQGKPEQLNTTEVTQPVLLTASVALWRLWQSRCHVQPAWLAGHSLGEFSALVCAGSLAFHDALLLVRDRGRFMQNAVPIGRGAMAAVLGLDDQTVIDICAAITQKNQGVVEAVNFNAPGQVVIAGYVADVEQAIEQCKLAGAKKALLLPVSAPFHTSLMRPASEQLTAMLATITVVSPAIPVVHNVNAQTEQDPRRIKQLLLEQIFSPVKWVACVQAMLKKGVVATVECGPGKVLSGLNKRIDKTITSFTTDEVEHFERVLATIA